MSKKSGKSLKEKRANAGQISQTEALLAYQAG
jgi:hypothetical protein